jgi:hypothetical protein
VRSLAFPPDLRLVRGKVQGPHYAPKLSSISELHEDLLQRSRKLARIMY